MVSDVISLYEGMHLNYFEFRPWNVCSDAHALQKWPDPEAVY